MRPSQALRQVIFLIRTAEALHKLHPQGPGSSDQPHRLDNSSSLAASFHVFSEQAPSLSNPFPSAPGFQFFLAGTIFNEAPHKLRQNMSLTSQADSPPGLFKLLPAMACTAFRLLTYSIVAVSPGFVPALTPHHNLG